MDKIVTVLWESALAFVVLFIISKLLGKKQVAQLQFSDYAIGISIGSIAAQMAFDTEFPYYTYIIAMAVFAGLDLLFTYASRKSKLLKQVLTGEPLILIENGNLNYKNLVRSKLDINELIGQARLQGFFDLTQIDYCVFEISGDFSFLPKPEFKQPCAQDLSLSIPKAEMTEYIVIDGKIDRKKLHQFGLTEQEVMQKLGLKQKSELKKIALAILYHDHSIKAIRSK